MFCLVLRFPPVIHTKAALIYNISRNTIKMSYLDNPPQNKQSLVVFMKEMCYRDHIFFFCQLVGKKYKKCNQLKFLHCTTEENYNRKNS